MCVLLLCVTGLLGQLCWLLDRMDLQWNVYGHKYKPRPCVCVRLCVYACVCVCVCVWITVSLGSVRDSCRDKQHEMQYFYRIRDAV